MRSWYARAGLILTQELGDLVVTAAKLADLAVTTAKIAALAITEAKIAALAVTEPKIADGAVTTPKLAQLSVGTGKIIDRAVTAIKLATNAVRSSNMGTTTFSASGDVPANSNVSVLLNPYSFWPRLFVGGLNGGGVPSDAFEVRVIPNSTGGGGADDPRFSLLDVGGQAQAYAIDCRSMLA